MKLKKVHKVVKFDQDCWMEPYAYIRMNTEFRKKAKNQLEKNFYQLCVRENHGERSKESKHQNHATQWNKKNRKLIAGPSCAGCTRFSNDLAGFRMQNESVTLDKPVYAEMTILDDSKILMYDFHYNVLKTY